MAVGAASAQLFKFFSRPYLAILALPPVALVAYGAKKVADKIKENKEKEKAMMEEKISKLKREVERLQSLIENDK